MYPEMVLADCFRTRALIGLLPNHSGHAFESPINEYHLATETGLPVSHMSSRTLDGDGDADAQYFETHTFVDGLGRTVASLSEADPDPVLGDGYGWVASGFVDYDKKGAPRRGYVSFAYNGNVVAFMQSLVPPPGTDFAQTRNDAFGRAVETIGLDGKVASRTRYHALSVDRWDAEDLGPGPHQGTYASEYLDGFGRVKRTTVRVREGGAMDLRHLDRAYLPTGELTSLTRCHGSETATVPGPGAVARTMRYDSLGRMKQNVEPSTPHTRRGRIKQLDSTYGLLVEHVKRTAEGLTTEVRYGDAAGNPTEIRDWRIASEWPSGAKPVTRKLAYDDLYRLKRIDDQHADGYQLEQASSASGNLAADYDAAGGAAGAARQQ